MPGPEPDNACVGCDRTIARDKTQCNACSGTASSVSAGDRKRAEWARVAAERDAARDAGGSRAAPIVDHKACASCGRTIARDETLCNACSRTADDVVGDRKRAEWARVAAERDAARDAGGSGAAPVVDHKACASCGRTISRDQTLCNACSRTADDVVGDRKRAEWARVAAERDAAQDAGGSRAAPIAPTPGLPAPSSPAANASTDSAGDPAHQAARRRRRIRYLVFAGAALATSSAVLAVVRRRAPSQPTPPDPPAARIAKAATFEQAIAIARPSFADTTDDLSEGAQLLSIYAAAKLRWSEVDVPAETTIRDVETNIELGRGKRLCATGEIRQMTRRDLGGRKVHVGRLRTGDVDEVAFVAVGTMGDLVERSTGRLCGVVLGASGAAVSILGMFDVAENRLPRVEQE